MQTANAVTTMSEGAGPFTVVVRPDRAARRSAGGQEAQHDLAEELVDFVQENTTI